MIRGGDVLTQRRKDAKGDGMREGMFSRKGAKVEVFSGYGRE